MDAAQRGYYTVAEVARLKGVTRATVVNWIHANLLSAWREGGDRSPWRIPLDALDEVRHANRAELLAGTPRRRDN